ncbi:hypothetical protein [Pandoraea sputorum]
MKVLLSVALLLFAQTLFAQSPADLANGKAFANTIAPTSPSQVVNPAGVNGGVWGNQTSAPTTVPSGLGGFSSPNTTDSLFAAAKGTSLTAMGNQTMIDCANFVPGNDPYKNQACAAVNFLNNQCMQATTGQKSVLGNTGTAQGSAANCAGTFGAGQSQYGYGDQITPNDPIFQGTLGLGNSAGGTTGQTCTPTNVVVKPAEYATNTCTVSTTMDNNACSQYLNVKVTTTTGDAQAAYNCPDGYTYSAGSCFKTTSAPATWTCPPGWTLYGNACGQQVYTSPTPSCPAPMWMETDGTLYVCYETIGYDGVAQLQASGAQTWRGMAIVGMSFDFVFTFANEGCPSGYSYNGTNCSSTITTGIQYACPNGGSLQGQSCITSQTTSSTTTYSCPSGQILSGSNCITKTLSTSWSNTCGVYEASSGSTIGVPKK